jgi:hypothetical protein
MIFRPGPALKPGLRPRSHHVNPDSLSSVGHLDEHNKKYDELGRDNCQIGW